MSASKYLGTNYPNGFNPGTKKPIDVRTVVDTIEDRNHLEFTFPGMKVIVLGAMVMLAGHPTYPEAAEWKLLVDRPSNFAGQTTYDQDWARADVAGTIGGGAGYKGPVNFKESNPPGGAPEVVPNLLDPALRATLKAGDFYKVGSVAVGAFNIDGVQKVAVNDSLFWDGARFSRFENTNPQAINPLYKDTESQQFEIDVLRLIRLNTLKEFQPGKAYEINSYVKYTYAVEVGGTKRTYVDTYVAVATMTAPDAALPTATTPNPNWLLVSTTNGAKLGGTAEQDDTIGRAATGANRPTTRTPGKYLSIEEMDARIKQYGGAAAGPMIGGNAATFLTADPNETPRN